jgi:hypothetical protein
LREVMERWLCRHEKQIWVRNIYGDEINACNGKRSLWACKDCGKRFLRDKPEFELETHGSKLDPMDYAERWNSASEEARKFAAWHSWPGILPHAVAEIYDAAIEDSRTGRWV